MGAVDRRQQSNGQQAKIESSSPDAERWEGFSDLGSFPSCGQGRERHQSDGRWSSERKFFAAENVFLPTSEICDDGGGCLQLLLEQNWIECGLV